MPATLTVTPATLRERGNTAGPIRRPFRTAHATQGVLLDARPFLRWVAAHWPEDGIDTMPNGGAALARRLRALVDGQELVSDSVIEKAGILLQRNPRITAELYPDLAEPVCAVCRAERGCQHLVRS